MRSLQEIDRLYSFCAAVAVQQHLITHAAFEAFSRSTWWLTREMNTLPPHDPLRPLFGQLRRVRFDLAAAPLPATVALSLEAASELESKLRALEPAYTTLRVGLEQLVEDMHALLRDPANPMFERIADLHLAAGGRGAVVVAAARLLAPTQRVVVESLPDAGLGAVAASSLRGTEVYDVLYLAGPARWFPQHVISAPRAPSIVVVQHDWIRDRPESLPSFIESRGPGGVPRTAALNLRLTTSGSPSLNLYGITPEELKPKLDLTVLSESQRLLGHSGVDEEAVEATVLRLVDDIVVLMDGSDGSFATVLDFERGGSPVGRMQVRDIEAGVFVVLRTEGSGDYVLDVANQLLGERAAEARHQQREWKRSLRRAIQTRGADVVISELQRSGARRANPQNLRNWASERNISTDDRADFDGILHVTGLAHRSEELWATMQTIRRAHLKAGAHIRRQLIERAGKVEPQELQLAGHMEFSLEDGGGSLTAYRVEEVRPERLTAFASQLDRPLRIDG
ncbi:MAG: hypothetical protein R2706_19700 [Acidimicrobiales bacterium]